MDRVNKISALNNPHSLGRMHVQRAKRIRRWQAVTRVMAVAAALVAMPQGYADVLPPGLEQLNERAAAHPQAIDRSDPFCAGKAIGGVCHIPGTPFEGGGAGLCQRQINEAERSLDLRCERELSPEIDRALPSGPFPAPSRFCGAQVDPMVAAERKDQGLSCEPVPLAADQFCSAHAVGDACTVRYRLGSAGEHEETGHCEKRTQTQRYRFRDGHGHAEAIARETLQCEPLHPVSAPLSSH